MNRFVEKFKNWITGKRPPGKRLLRSLLRFSLAFVLMAANSLSVQAAFVQIYVRPEGDKTPFWDNLSKELLSFYSSCLKKDYPAAELKANEVLETASRADDKGLAVAFCKSNIAKLYDETKNYEKAKAFLLEAVPILEKQASKADPIIAVSYEKLANLCISMRDLSAAEQYNKKAMDACTQFKDEHHEVLLRFLDQQALISLAQHKLAISLEQYDKAIKIAEQEPGQKSMLARLLDNSAEIRGLAGETDRAYQMNKEAIRICEQAGFNEELSKYLTHIAARTMQMQSWSEAAGYIDRALEIENKKLQRADAALISKLKIMRELVESKLKSPKAPVKAN